MCDNCNTNVGGTIKELSFTKDGKTYVAQWKGIEAIYNEDRKNSIHLTKFTYTAVYSKPLQRQSVVCPIFNDKTVAALSTLKDKLGISEGILIFVKLITDWFHMMNVEDRYSGINMRDECRQPWTKDCTSFKKLSETCDVISSCSWTGGKGQTQKLTKQTANGFVLSTIYNIQAAELLLTQHNFDYVLPGHRKVFLPSQTTRWGKFLHWYYIYQGSCTPSLMMCLALPTFALMTINLTSLLLTLNT